MKRKIRQLIGAAIAAFLFFSCSEPYAESIELERFMYLSLSGSKDSPILKPLNQQENFTYSFTVAYGGTTNYNQGEIVAQIAPDNSLVDRYNEENNTTYLALPAGSVSFDKASATIEDGKNTSDVVTLTVNTTMVSAGVKYLLPVTVQSATSEKIPVNDEFKTVYLILEDRSMLADKHLWTVHGSSSILEMNSAAYGADKVWDGSRKTYWHSGFDAPQWFSVNMNDYKVIDGFTWVNRYDGNDLPKHVTFETSMDGETWNKVLDIEIPFSRLLQVFELPERVLAKYFKVNVLSTWSGSNCTYAAELSIWAGEKPAPGHDWEKHTWQVHSYSSQWHTGWPEVKSVFDGDKNTCWHSDLVGLPQWFVLDMIKQRPPIKGIKIWNRQNDDGNCAPKHIIFSVSSDAENWKVILEVLEMTHGNAVELDYKTTDPAGGRYLKVEVKSNWAGYPWTHLAEVTPYEYDD